MLRNYKEIRRIRTKMADSQVNLCRREDNLIFSNNVNVSEEERCEFCGQLVDDCNCLEDDFERVSEEYNNDEPINNEEY